MIITSELNRVAPVAVPRPEVHAVPCHPDCVYCCQPNGDSADHRQVVVVNPVQLRTTIVCEDDCPYCNSPESD